MRKLLGIVLAISASSAMAQSITINLGNNPPPPQPVYKVEPQRRDVRVIEVEKENPGKHKGHHKHDEGRQDERYGHERGRGHSKH